MANDVEVIPTTIDYTNRDYFSLREALIARVRDRIPNWQGTDANDFGIALIESFAYLGDVMSYYTDRVANEMSFETASQRSSVLNLASMFGYVPSGYQSATSTFDIHNSSASEITLPIGTQFRGTYDSGDVVIPVIFEISEEAVVPAQVGLVDGKVEDVPAYHGENVALRNVEENGLAGEEVGASNGKANQQFRLLENQIVENSIRVFVLRNTTYEEWLVVGRLIDYGPQDTVASVFTDANDFAVVSFGDGVSGKIPPTDATIKVQYLIGGGSDGRVPANIGFLLYKVPGVSNITALASALTVFNTVGVGGASPESTASIRDNAPAALTALNRAVSLTDFANLTLKSTDVGKSQASASTFTSVNVYVAPSSEDSAQDPYPIYDPTTYLAAYDAANISTALLTNSWETLQLSAENELYSNTQIGVSYTVLPPTYVPVKITLRYTKATNVSDSDIISAMKAILEAKYGYTKMRFKETLYPEDVETWIRLTPGVLTANVTELYRRGDSAGRKALVGDDGEIFRIVTSNADIQAAGTDSSPTAITLSGLSLSPVFAPSTTSYNTGSTTTGSTILRVSGVPTAVLSYNSNVQEISTSGAVLIADITLAVGNKNLVIQCTAEDGVTTTTYTIGINKTA